MLDFIGIGEILVDLTGLPGKCGEDTVFVRNPGGAPANVACALAKLGRKAAFCGKVGRDAFGEFCVDALRNNGVITDYVSVSEDRPTTLALVALDAAGDRTFAFYRSGTADTQLTGGDVRELPLSQTRIFHFGTVSLSCEPARQTVLDTVQAAKAAGATISCDLNLREALWTSRAEMKRSVTEMLRYTPIDLLKVSREELLFIGDSGDTRRAMEEVARIYSIPVLLVTCGAQGSMVLADGQFCRVEAYDVPTKDTTGAGDIFLAGALFFLLDNGLPLRGLAPDQLEAMLCFANAMASLSTTRSGAIPSIPKLEEIQRLMEWHCRPRAAGMGGRV